MQAYPAVKGKLGNWSYYQTSLKATELASHIKFASEFEEEGKTLDDALQRTLNENRATRNISKYLAEAPDHFFNSIVVAAIGGNPQWRGVDLGDSVDEIYAEDMEDSVGMLFFNNKVKYYALDGQHRLKAIKSLVDETSDYEAPPGFRDEEYPVLVIVPSLAEQSEGGSIQFKRKYRRLFSHLNRHAKPMDRATTIIMEEDEAAAICTRRLIMDHPFFQWFVDDHKCRIRALGGKAIKDSENHFTTIITLYEMNCELLQRHYASQDMKKYAGNHVVERPDDDVLDLMSVQLTAEWDAIINTVPDLLTETPSTMRHAGNGDYDGEQGERFINHLLFRPIGQLAFAKAVRLMFQSGGGQNEGASLVPQVLETSLAPLKQINWSMHSAPWKYFVIKPKPLDESKWVINTVGNEQIRLITLVIRWLVGESFNDEESEQDLYEQWCAALNHGTGFPDGVSTESMWAEAKEIRDRCTTGLTL